MYRGEVLLFRGKSCKVKVTSSELVVGTLIYIDGLGEVSKGSIIKFAEWDENGSMYGNGSV